MVRTLILSSAIFLSGCAGVDFCWQDCQQIMPVEPAPKLIIEQ